MLIQLSSLHSNISIFWNNVLSIIKNNKLHSLLSLINADSQAQTLFREVSGSFIEQRRQKQSSLQDRGSWFLDREDENIGINFLIKLDKKITELLIQLEGSGDRSKRWVLKEISEKKILETLFHSRSHRLTLARYGMIMKITSQNYCRAEF